MFGLQARSKLATHSRHEVAMRRRRPKPFPSACESAGSTQESAGDEVALLLGAGGFLTGAPSWRIS